MLCTLRNTAIPRGLSGTLLILFGPFLDLETPLLVPIHDPFLEGILLHTIPMIPKGNDEGLLVQSDSVTKCSKRVFWKRS